MSASGIGLVVKIAADTRQAVGDIHDVNNALQGTGTSATGASNFIKGMKGPALAALGAVAGAALAAGAAMIEFGKAAWEDHQEAERLARTLQTIPGITQDMIDANEAWITQTMFATHVLDTDLRQAISDLTLVTGDLSTAQQYAVASANLATVADVEYSAAVAAVEKALAGKTTSLMKMAPWLDTNKDGTLSAAEAQAILTNETLKGAAAAEAADDPWTTMKIIWDEIKEQLGQWLLPLMEDLSDWFKNPENQKKIQEYITKIGDLSREFGEKLLPKLEEFLDWVGSPQGQRDMKKFADSAKVIADAIVAISDALAKMIGWYNKIPAPLKGMIGSGMGLTPWESGGSPGALAMPAGLSVNSTAGTVGNRAVVINFNGVVGDQEGTARALQGVLNQSDRRTNRSALARAGDARW